MSKMLEFPTTVACYCGQAAYPITLYSPTAQHNSEMCHCTSCRQWSGGLATAAISSSAPPSALLTSDSGVLTCYKTSPDTDRWFCTRCGSHMQVHHLETDTWKVYPGVVKDWAGTGLEMTINAHEFVGDTKDGGYAAFWPKSGGKSLDSWEGEGDVTAVLPVGWRAPEAKKALENAADANGQDKLLAQCHCGGVSFYITRPTEASKSAIPRGWLGPLGPYPHAETHDAAQETWWLRPLAQEKRTKYLTVICACDTCQRGLGFWAPAWAFVPACNLVDERGEQVDLTRLGTLKDCNKGDRPGVHRGFCGVCGATTTWWREGMRPLVDVAVGILRAPEGARAETWLEWHTERFMQAEYGQPESIWRDLKEGLAPFGEKGSA